ncbi:hypothetical protein BH09ACT12_BH09ACT12_00870 [soil metagenome]
MAAVTNLSYSECEVLLRAGVFGRLALVTPDGPDIVPLNYRVIDNAVMVCTAADTLLARCAGGASVAFEVDLVDHERWRGWSIVAKGTAEVVEGSEPRGSHFNRPRPWADGDRNVWIRLPWTSLSGRQLGTGWDALLAMPARTTL